MFSFRKVNSLLLKNNQCPGMRFYTPAWQYSILKKVEPCQLAISVKKVELNPAIYFAKNVFLINSVILCDQLYPKVIQQKLVFH